MSWSSVNDLNATLKSKISSIEANAVNNTTSIELPHQIDSLIDNKNYRNKFKKLMREGHLVDLLELAQVAQTKNKPSCWFARATRTTPLKGHENEPTFWERSLKYLAKLREVRRTAQVVANKLGTQVTGFIYKQVWLGVNIERWADQAKETGRNKLKYFAWLCNNMESGV